MKKRKIPEINLSKKDTKNFNEREFYEEVMIRINWAQICQLGKKDPHIACKRFYDYQLQLDEYALLRKIETSVSAMILCLKSKKFRTLIFRTFNFRTKIFLLYLSSIY